MLHYKSQGILPAKRSTILRGPTGQMRYEELINSIGFSGPSAFLYHLRQSPRLKRVEPLVMPATAVWDVEVVRNHLIELERVETATGGAFESRSTIASNDEFAYSISRPTNSSSDFYRNAFADELFVIVEGGGTVETAFGNIAFEPLDFVYIPRGITWRLALEDKPQLHVVIETPDPISPPAHFRNPCGQFTSRALYTERDIRGPILVEPIDELGEFTVKVKTGNKFATHVLPNHPFDVVGWDGALYPFALSMTALEPQSGRVHLTPDFYQVFGSRGSAICAITPNRLPDHPEIVPAQPDHIADCDEIFHRFSADGPAAALSGTLTMHTRAAPHGPKPGFEDLPLPEKSSLWGIIIDVFRPVQLMESVIAADDPDYAQAWLS